MVVDYVICGACGKPIEGHCGCDQPSPPPDVVEAAVLFHDWNCDDGEEIKYSYAKHPWKRLEDDELSKIEHLQCAILAKWVLGEKS